MIVLPVFATPVPPYCPTIGPVKSAVPLNELPYILLAVCNSVVVLALPAKLPVTFPVTLPVTSPVNEAVIVPALKLPFASLLTNVEATLLEVAEAIVLAMFVIVEELTPPMLLDELVILEFTKAAVATSVPLAASVGVVAVGAPVKEADEIVGDTIVLLVKVSVPAKVAIVPVVGNVILVSPVLVSVVLKLPAVVNALAVVILPPKVIVLPVFATPVPPYCPAIGPVKSAVPLNELPYILLAVCNSVVVLALPAKLPVTLPVTSPVTFPVTFPVNDAVIVPALKLPLPSL